MLITKTEVRKDIRGRLAFVREKTAMINKNIGNEHPDPGYVHEKLEKIRDETLEIQRIVNMLAEM